MSKRKSLLVTDRLETPSEIKNLLSSLSHGYSQGRGISWARARGIVFPLFLRHSSESAVCAHPERIPRRRTFASLIYEVAAATLSVCLAACLFATFSHVGIRSVTTKRKRERERRGGFGVSAPPLELGQRSAWLRAFVTRSLSLSRQIRFGG